MDKTLLCNNGTGTFRKVLLCLLTACCALPLLWSCKDENYARKEYILVSDSLDFSRATSNAMLYCPVTGGSSVIYVDTNTEFELSFQTKDKEKDWIKVTGQRYNANFGLTEVLLEIAPQLKSYEQRTGTLTLVASGIYLNSFVKTVQGYKARTGSNFDWLMYGSSNPLEGLEGKLMKDWTPDQKELGWKSTPQVEGETAYCYGRDGFIQLGDAEKHGADLITPYTIDMKQRDTAILVRFRAVAYTSKEGLQDQSTLTVAIEGGGEFVDGSKAKTINVKNLNPAAEKLEEAMWEESAYEFYVIRTPENPFTSDTHVRLMSGDYTMTEGNNRIFVDDFFIFTLERLWWDRLFGGLPWDESLQPNPNK